MTSIQIDTITNMAPSELQDQELVAESELNLLIEGMKEHIRRIRPDRSNLLHCAAEYWLKLQLRDGEAIDQNQSDSDKKCDRYRIRGLVPDIENPPTIANLNERGSRRPKVQLQDCHQCEIQPAPDMILVQDDVVNSNRTCSSGNEMSRNKDKGLSTDYYYVIQIQFKANCNLHFRFLELLVLYFNGQ